MKIAALGDIHSNHVALEACLEQAQRSCVDGIAFLGDYVSDCPNPQKTLALIRQAAARWPVWFVKGNREEYLIAHGRNPDDGWKDGSRSGSLLYTFDHLTDGDLDAFDRMPISAKVCAEGAEPFEICHGAPWRTRGMLLPDTPETDRAMRRMRTRLLLCAHTHAPMIYEKDGKTIVNGGAVGVPVNGRTGAGYAMIEYDGERWTPELVCVEYDFERAVREFTDTDFAARANVWARAVAACLRTGRNYPLECLQWVEARAARLGLTMDHEVLWEDAARALEIPGFF